MLKEAYLIIARWPGRQETFSDCARDISNLFIFLKEIDPIFSKWPSISRILGQNYSDSIITSDIIEKVILEQEERWGNKTKTSDGYELSLESDSPYGHRVFINIRCGCVETKENSLDNFVIITMPPLDQNDQLLTIDHFTNITQCIVTSMRPMWASVRPSKLVWMKSERDSKHPQVGWITYLSIPFQQMPGLTAPSYAEGFANGVIIIATNEPFSQLNRTHVALTETIDELLVHAGIFKLNITEHTLPPKSKVSIHNNYSTQVDFCIEPDGEVYPMLPKATFEIVGGDEISIVEGGIFVYGVMEVYYNSVRIWHSD